MTNWGDGEKLNKVSLKEIPKYIEENLIKYKIWLDI